MTLGINHEQQHQELIITDVKNGLWTNPLRPAFRATAERHDAQRAVRRLSSGAASTKGFTASVLQATASLSTTRARATGFISDHFAWRRGW